MEITLIESITNFFSNYFNYAINYIVDALTNYFNYEINYIVDALTDIRSPAYTCLFLWIYIKIYREITFKKR